MYYYDNPNIIWSIGGKIDWKLARGLHVGINETDIGQYAEKTNFDYINGSCHSNKKKSIRRYRIIR